MKAAWGESCCQIGYMEMLGEQRWKTAGEVQPAKLGRRGRDGELVSMKLKSGSIYTLLPSLMLDLSRLELL